MYKIPSLFSLSDIEPITIDEIVALIRSKEMQELILPIRQKCNADKAKSMKLRLPLFTLANCKDRIDSEHFIDTKYLIFDVDDLDLAAMKKQHVDVLDPLFVFLSPRGRGFKFIIEMESPIPKVDYRLNYKHYAELFSAETGLKLDKNYTSLHTFLSWDKDCGLNPTPRRYPVLKGDVISKSADVDPLTVADEEVRAVCEYLSHKVLSFAQYTAVAFALNTIEGGKGLFLAIGANDDTPGHKHRNWSQKFDQCKNPRDITIGSLFAVAFAHGYERSPRHITDGRGKYNPFTEKKDGLYYCPKDPDKIPQRVFGFKTIAVIYNIHDVFTGNKVRLRVDNKEITVKATAFSSAGEFRKAIQNQLPGSPFMLTNSKAVTYYDMLFNYIDKLKPSLTVTSLPGVGQVADNVWNFGSVVCLDGNVMPYDPLITSGDRGYALDDVRNSVYVKDVPGKLIKKLRLMHSMYLENAATAVGWAVANVWYKEILSECGGFPILFLYGKSSSGKSKLANIILAMFGVRNPETSMFRLSLAAGATQTAMTRSKNGSVGIPQFFDEYGTNKDNRSREQHFQILKGLFDGVGKTMARKTNDDQVHRMDIGSGSIFASVDKDNREEALNRCVYIDMNGVKDTSPGAIQLFQKEFMSPKGLEELSSFMMHVVLEKEYREFVQHYEHWVSYLSETSRADSRVIVNWAIVAAGFSVVSSLFKDEVPSEWWAMMADKTSSFVEESDPVSIFLQTMYYFALKDSYHSFVMMEDYDPERGECVLLFHLEHALREAEKDGRFIDRQINMTAKELRERLKTYPGYIEGSRQVRFGEKNLRACAVRYKENT